MREPFEVDAGRRDRRGACATPPPRCSARRRAIGGASYWADAAFIAAAGIPTVLFGPGGEGAHAAEEWVSIADTEAGRAHAGRRRRARSARERARQPGASTRRAVPAAARARRRAFHAALPGYAPTPLRELPALAAELGLGAVALKDESDRLGLPAFKVLGASWAVERALRERARTSHTLVAASAGNHGRAVAHVAARRGLRCRVFLPGARGAGAARGDRRRGRRGRGRRRRLRGRGGAARPRRRASRACSRSPTSATSRPGALGRSTATRRCSPRPPRRRAFDVVLVPVGVGSLGRGRGALRRAAPASQVIGVEPATAACLTASLRGGRADRGRRRPGTTMAGPRLRRGLGRPRGRRCAPGSRGTVTVDRRRGRARAMRELAAAGLAIGECGAAPLAALRALARRPGVRRRCATRSGSARARASLLIATEGPTDPAAYRRAVG